MPKKEKKEEDFEKLAEEYLAGWQRTKADYVNFKKDQETKLKEFKNIAKAELTEKLIPILDAWDEALKNIKKKTGDNEWIQGFLNIEKQLKRIMEKEGLEEVKAEKGQEFDPMIHEAVEQVESALPEGHVVGLLQKGYGFAGRLLRAAKVKVSKGNKKTK
jgi:molecular chaperone GrpE